MRTRTKVAGGVGGGTALLLLIQLLWEVYANAEDPRMIGDVARFLADPPSFLVLMVLMGSLWLLWVYNHDGVTHARKGQAHAEEEVGRLKGALQVEIEKRERLETERDEQIDELEMLIEICEKREKVLETHVQLLKSQ